MGFKLLVISLMAVELIYNWIWQNIRILLSDGILLPKPRTNT